MCRFSSLFKHFSLLKLTFYFFLCQREFWKQPKISHFVDFDWENWWGQLDINWYLSLPPDASMGVHQSTSPDVVPLLPTRCLNLGGGVHLTEGQPEPKADQMSSWPDVVLLLATRCLYCGGTSDWRSAWPKDWPTVKLTWPKGWPNVMLTWCSTSLAHEMPLLGGYIWLKVSLTKRLTKCQADLTQRLTKCQADLM